MLKKPKEHFANIFWGGGGVDLVLKIKFWILNAPLCNNNFIETSS